MLITLPAFFFEGKIDLSPIAQEQVGQIDSLHSIRAGLSTNYDLADFILFIHKGYIQLAVSNLMLTCLLEFHHQLSVSALGAYFSMLANTFEGFPSKLPTSQIHNQEKPK